MNQFRITLLVERLDATNKWRSDVSMEVDGDIQTEEQCVERLNYIHDLIINDENYPD